MTPIYAHRFGSFSNQKRISVFFYTLILCLWAAVGANASTTIPASTLSSAHWTLAGSPYLITGHIIVANNDSLVIDSGVRVEFQGKYKLFCNGKILANGTASQPILFTVPVANHAIGWLGIRYDNTPTTNGRSYFKYCHLEYGHADVVGDNLGGAMYFNNYSNCEISNCSFQNNYATYGGAIRGQNSSPTILRDSFNNNSSYAGGSCVELISSSSTIDGCLFVDGGVYATYSSLSISNSHFLRCNGEGGISSFAMSTPSFCQILNNVFDSCSQSNGSGGGAILLLNTAARIEHNIFRNNVSPCGGGAISCCTQTAYSNTNNTVISNNLFYGNKAHISKISDPQFGGGAINFSNCSGTIMNNTIVNNYSDTAGGAIFCYNGSSPLFANNIIFDNSVNIGVENIFIMDNPSDPDFYNNDIQGGFNGINTNGTPLVGANVNTINLTPGFTNPSANIYTLGAGSPGIDAGSTSGLSSVPALDLAGNPRITGAAIDLGAYESAGSTTGVNPLSTSSLRLVPNPTTNYFQIIGVDLNEIKSVQLLDIQGRQLAYNENVAGNHFDLSNIPSGIFLVSCTYRNDQMVMMRIIKN